MVDFHPKNFGGLPPELSSRDNSRFILLSVPYEATTTYGKGTKFGPSAIIEASRNMELYDEELGFEPSDRGIHTTGEVHFEDMAPEAMVKTVKDAVAEYIRDYGFVFSLGGEHSISYPAFMAHREAFGEIGIVQIDAHADLRNEYLGSPYNHACVMRRIAGETSRIVQVGIRSMSREEARLIAEDGWPVVSPRVCNAGDGWMDEAFESLPERVYLTIDIDGLDPSLVPCTGTPVPGGLEWHPLTSFLRRLCRERCVVGADLVELAPDGVHRASEFLAAKLVYKLMGYVLNGENV